jgi:hypothetical protein
VSRSPSPSLTSVHSGATMRCFEGIYSYDMW